MNRKFFIILGIVLLIFLLIASFFKITKKGLFESNFVSLKDNSEDENEIKQEEFSENDITEIPTNKKDEGNSELKENPDTMKQTPTPALKVTVYATPTVIPKFNNGTNNPTYYLFTPSDLSGLVSYEGKILNIKKDRIAFAFNADWEGENEEETLFIGNFNGQNQKDALIITGSGNSITSDFYNMEGGHVANDSNAILPEDYIGKNYFFEMQWDFTSTPMVIRLFLDGQLNNTIYPEYKPESVNPKILVNELITDLEIGEK